MATITNVTDSSGVEWEQWDYGNNEFYYQRVCPTCDKGLVSSPTGVKFCSECKGDGYLMVEHIDIIAEEATEEYVLEKLASVVAEITAGFKGAEPTQDDRDEAVEIRARIERKLKGEW